VVAGQQQLFGLLDAPAGDELMRRLVEGLGEQAVEIERRKAGLAGGFGQKNGLRVVCGQIVAGTAEAAERARIERPRAGRSERAEPGGPMLKFTQRRFTPEENFA
jgi:hypothetical protein